MRSRRFLSMFSLFFLIFLILQLYIGLHGWWFLSTLFPTINVWSYGVIFGIIALSYLIATFGRKVLPYSVTAFFKYVGSYWLAVFEYSVILLPIADISAWILYLCSVPLDLTILIVGSIVLALLLGMLIVGSWNAWSPRIRKEEIKVAKSAGDFEQLTVAVASDLHLGMIVGNRHIKRLIRNIREINPDLILLAGDVLDDEIRPFIRHRMAETLKELEAPLGVFAILGNHEYIGGDVEEYIKRMDEIGIKVLTDEAMLVADSFYIIGRKDKAVHTFEKETRLELDEIIKKVDKSKPLILMDHQPNKLEEASAIGIDVMLSGHTHRGQLAPNHLITKKLFELDWGYLKKGSMHTIVSSGFGTWGPPIRIGSRSEIIQLIIRFEKEEDCPN